MNLIISFFLIYLVALIFIGFWGNKNSKSGSINDYFLAGGKVGLFPLFFTCYASFYSGETFVGVSGAGYTQGFIMLMFLSAMLAIATGLWIIAPKIKVLADKYKFITTGDFIDNRFNYPPLKYLANIGFLIAIILYILSNFKAISYIIDHTFNGVFSLNQTVIMVAIIMTIYESLGGMKSVIVTDIIQGILMLLGTFLIVIVLFYSHNFSELITQIKIARPQFFLLPSWGALTSMLSLIILVGISAVIYPHIIQRIYCADSVSSLKKMMAIFALSPFVSTFFVVVLGIAAIAFFPNLELKETAILNIVSYLSEGSTFLLIFSSLFFVSILAAIMSTIDSASLSASSIIVVDFIDNKKKLSEKKIIFFSRITIAVLMLLVVILTLSWQQSIFIILQHKLSILAQLSPIFFLGILKKRPSGKALFWGVVTGLSLIIFITIWREQNDITKKLFYFHDSLYFLLINLSVVFIINKIMKYKKTIIR